jgi:hypothetical protein
MMTRSNALNQVTFQRPEALKKPQIPVKAVSTQTPRRMSSSSSSSSFPSPDELKGAVQGTLLYLGLYLFILIPFQSFSKFYIVAEKKKEARAKGGNEKVSFRAIKYYNSKDLLALAGDRTVGNFIEFAILFLPLMWMHALFVDPSSSFWICLVYTASRSYYPIAFLKGSLVLLSTAPGYLIYGYLFYELTFKFALA